MEKEKVSAIITTYNREFSVLEKAILSVVNQTYQNKEIIVVDDNNQLRRAELCLEEKIKKYKNVKYVKH